MIKVRNALIVGRYTFLELYKSRILLNVVLLGLVLAVITYVASEFTFGAPEKIALDFGLGLTNLSILGISIFMGVNLVAKEIESRTVYMILSRPISRAAFLIGRVLGMGGIFFLNVSILGFLSTLFYILLGGQFNSLLIWSLVFMFLEAGIMLLVVIFFSLISNPILTVIFSISVYVGSHSISAALETTFIQLRPSIEKILSSYSFIFPDFSKLNIKNYVIYEQSLESGMLFQTLGYGIGYFIFLIFVTTYIFNQKNLD